MKKIHLIISLIAITQLTACVHRSYVSDSSYGQRYQQPYSTTYSSQNQYDDRYDNRRQQTEVAQIVDMRLVSDRSRNDSGNSNGGGAVVGAIIGGVIGNQLGKGSEHHVNNRRSYRYDTYSNNGGRAAATIGGALIGGLIGSAVENSNDNNRQDYRNPKTEITLRLRNGEVRNIVVDHPGHLRVGDRVRVTFQQGHLVIL